MRKSSVYVTNWGAGQTTGRINDTRNGIMPYSVSADGNGSHISCSSRLNFLTKYHIRDIITVQDWVDLAGPVNLRFSPSIYRASRHVGAVTEPNEYRLQQRSSAET